MSRRNRRYGRTSTTPQLTAAQVAALETAPNTIGHIYFDEGKSGEGRNRPELLAVLADCLKGEALYVTQPDRLSRNVDDGRDIARELAARDIVLSFRGAEYDVRRPLDLFVLTVLFAAAEFDQGQRTQGVRAGVKAKKARGEAVGRKRKLTAKREKELVAYQRTGEHKISEIAEHFGVGVATVYRILKRYKGQTVKGL